MLTIRYKIAIFNYKSTLYICKVVNGYIVFEIDKGTDYFVKTRDKELTTECPKEEKKINLFLIVSIVEALIIVGGIFFFFQYKKKMEEKLKSSTNNDIENKNTMIVNNPNEGEIELPKMN